MQKIKLIFSFHVLAILATTAFGQDNEKFYPITKDNLWGYINNTGNTIITPQFLAAGQFSEGLSAVRLNGTYGYIDKSGLFVISPKYDLARSFKNGIAKVFIDGKPYFIDRKGNLLFQHNYKSITEYNENSLATVVTETDKYGVINKSGVLVIDTAFANISAFSNGVAVVTGLNHHPFSNNRKEKIVYESGIVDTLGTWVVPYGKYKVISEFKNGYAQVELIVEKRKGKGYSKNTGIIDHTGQYKFTVPSNKWDFDYEYEYEFFYQDIALVSIFSGNIDTVTDWNSFYRNRIKGAVNTKGEILFSNSKWKEITPFTLNRAFALDYSDNWYLINTTGNIVVSTSFSEILNETYDGQPESIFQDGKAFVETTNGWGAIDTNGNFVIQPNDLNDVDYDNLIRRGNHIIIEEDVSSENEEYYYQYGFWNTTNNNLIEPKYHHIDMNGFNNDIIYAMKDGINYYINSNGEVIWQDTTSKTSELANLNIDFMNRGYFYAYSKPNNEDLGGFGSSDNLPEIISKSNNFPPNILSVVVNPESKDTIYGNYNALTVYIANTTSKEINFQAQDSRLYMKVQALNAKGEWKDIEYLPSSWCGNSYHSLTLESNFYWTFQTPVYDGEFKTKLRIELKYLDPTDESDIKKEKKEITIYSNEYDGSINPGQFWNKREYYPNGLMDPYND